ncbi:SusE domain-containing protein [Dyadobacter pollutisoli]|uniref:SusE domain-containing protein n=1 Tax=Dyadobacter pollutisoli TaxID=2910158 RepID=A0A9E8SMG8_9BACT|nr:SusE domain-containing protein [Dyadobacter pollutisoli]WAC14730.1 SusE domain-containing protein [Dyadobacter pollutisoli]
MKTLNKIIFLGLTMVVAWGCEKEQDMAILNAGAVPVVKLSSGEVLLDKDKADADVLTVSWDTDFGYQAAASNTILIDKKGADFSKAASISAGSSKSKVFKASELNAILIGLGLTAGTAGEIDIRVTSSIGAATVLTSTPAVLKATAYSVLLDLTSKWGVVGSAANDWGASPDLPFYKTDVANVFVAYVNLIDGEMKFRENNDWAVNYGGANGVLKAGGDNIKITKGSYKITFNPVALTYKIEKGVFWGIVGDATATGWGDKPDQKFSYNPGSETWYLNNVVLKDGQIKFRLNDDWGANLGSTATAEPDPIAASGALKDGGKNFGVKAGTWNFELNVKDPAKPTYKATKIK